MAKDSILGWFLIFLVGASLFLSFSIWYQTPVVLPTGPTAGQEPKVDLASVVGPEKILVRFGDSTHTLLRPSSSFYDRAWTFSRKALVAQWSSISPDPMTLDKDFFARKHGIEATFSVPLPASAFRQLIDVKPADPPSLEGMFISSFILSVEDQKLVIYIENSEGLYHKFTKTGETLEFSEALKELSDSRPPLYARLPSGGGNLRISNKVYISLLSYELPVYSLKSERPPGERQVAEYFSDFSVARKIQEKDGAVIYTDGQRGLRVYEDGSLEYSFPGAPEQKKSSFYDALSAAVSFVNRHGGWPKNAYLAAYEVPEAGQYTFKFRVRINGYPVLGERDLLVVNVGGSEIKRLYRNMITIDRQIGTKAIDTPVKALDTAVAVKNIKNLDDIYPAYLLEGDELLPRWVVKTSDMEVVLPNPSE